MTFDLNKKNSQSLFVNFRLEGDGKKEASVSQLFTFSFLLDNSSLWMTSVERWRLGIQNIPMQDQLINAVVLRSKDGSPDIFISTDPTFSLYEWLLQFKDQDTPFNIILTADGRPQIFNFDFDLFSIEFSQVMSDILDLPITLDGVGIQSVTGASVLFDRFDQLKSISLECGLSLATVQQEIQSSEVFVTQLTDFIIPSEYAISTTNTLGSTLNSNITFTMPVRQDIEFNLGTRRMINFRGSSPLQNMSVSAVAIYKDGSRHAVVVPRNSEFTLKLGFFKKNESSSLDKITR